MRRERYDVKLWGRFFHGIGCLVLYRRGCVFEHWFRWWHPATWLILFPLAVVAAILSSDSIFDIMPLRPSVPWSELADRPGGGILPWWWAWCVFNNRNGEA